MKTKYNLILLFCLVMLVACEKEFLAKKPDKALLVPKNLADLRALLDNNAVMNQGPFYEKIATDDHFATDSYINNENIHVRNSYIWAKDIFEGYGTSDWDKQYQQIFYTNVILESLKELDKDKEPIIYNQLKGEALFLRALAFYYLAQEFAPPYIKELSNTSLGIPIRLSSDINIKAVRGTIEQTYARILQDLLEAKDLLPNMPQFKSRASKVASLALLARVYLTMGDYLNAEKYADICLGLYPVLIDYNLLNPKLTIPFPQALPNGNDEVLFYATLPSTNFFYGEANVMIDTNLYRTYNDNDLRKSILFIDKGKGGVNFRGNYSGNARTFVGIATDEVYLIRSECRARNGNLLGAMQDLNLLLQKRWKSNTYKPLHFNNVDEALTTILLERRKELVFRGTRWTDLRRLNADPRFQVTLKRIFNGKSYLLPPNDKRYVYPIPENEIKISGIEQNLR